MVVVDVKVRMTGKGRKKLLKLSNLRKPFKPELVAAIQAEMIRQIRATSDDSSSRPLPYHTYPSTDHAAGQLELNSFVNVTADQSGLEIGSHAPYASVLEFGRHAMWRSEHPFVFKGYYPNERIVSALLKKSRNPRLAQRMPYFSGAGSHLGAAFRYNAKGEMVERYDSGKRGEGMKRQNIRFIRETIASDNERLKSEYKRLGGANTQKEKKKAFKATRTISKLTSHKIHSFGLPLASIVSSNYKHGIYTVFAYRIKPMEPYHVFLKTAQWAKREIERNVKRKVTDMTYW